MFLRESYKIVNNLNPEFCQVPLDVDLCAMLHIFMKLLKRLISSPTFHSVAFYSVMYLHNLCVAACLALKNEFQHSCSVVVVLAQVCVS